MNIATEFALESRLPKTLFNTVYQRDLPLHADRHKIDDEPTTIVIDRRMFMREILVCGLRNLKGTVETYGTVDEWLNVTASVNESTLVLLSVSDHSAADLKREWTKIVTALGESVPVVLLAEEETASYVLAALSQGIRGYIPTSISLNVAVEAMELVRAGGTYAPVSALLQAQKTLTPNATGRGLGCASFTGRQAEVLGALRKGTSNKIIAHDLRMAESTVKVHVRNIMRKLKAHNRTHVAFILNELDSSTW